MNFEWADGELEDGVLMLSRQKVAVDLFGPFVKVAGISEWMSANPDAAKALLGAGIGAAGGGLLGGVASSRSGRKRPLAGALTGALVGGGLGAATGYGLGQWGKAQTASDLAVKAQRLAEAGNALKSREEEVPVISTIVQGMQGGKTSLSEMARPVARDAAIGAGVWGGTNLAKGKLVDAPELKGVQAVPNKQIKDMIAKQTATEANFGKQMPLASGGYGRPLVTKYVSIPGQPMTVMNDKGIITQQVGKRIYGKPALSGALKGGLLGGLTSALGRYYSAGRDVAPSTEQLKQDYNRAYQENYKATQQAQPPKPTEKAGGLEDLYNQASAWYSSRDPQTQKMLAGGAIGAGIGGLGGLLGTKKKRGLSGLLGAIAGGAAGVGGGYALDRYGSAAPKASVKPSAKKTMSPEQAAAMAAAKATAAAPVDTTEPVPIAPESRDVANNIVPYAVGGGAALGGAAYTANKFGPKLLSALGGLKSPAAKAVGSLRGVFKRPPAAAAPVGTPVTLPNRTPGGIGIKPLPSVAPPPYIPPTSGGMSQSLPVPRPTAAPPGPALSIPPAAGASPGRNPFGTANDDMAKWPKPKKPATFPKPRPLD